MTEKAIKTHISYAALLLLAITIAGCSAVNYEEPKSGPVARVRFVSDTKDISIIRSYKSKDCDDEYQMMTLTEGFYLNSDPRRLNIPLWNYHDNAAKEFFIKAEIPQIFMFVSANVRDRYVTKCGVFLEQKFDQGKDYELNYSWNNSKCYLNIYEIKTDNLGESKKNLLRKVDHTLPKNFSKNCLTKFKGFRWY